MSADLYATNALESYRWENRLLLVFSPREGDVRARAVCEEIEARACEVADHNLVAGYFPIFGDASLGDRALAPEAAAQIRNRFNVDFGDFAVILVGKDGYEKRRDTHVPDFDEIFGLIDGMPMRRAEMRARGAGCAD